MMSTAGFYKFDGEELRYGATAVYAPNFTLRLQDKETYQYPVFGWIYADSAEEAEQYFAINGKTKAQWIEFSAALDTQQGVSSLLEAAPLPLALKLAVGLGKAADGDSRVFTQAWSAAKAAGLVPPELLAAVVAMAETYRLPEDFVAAIEG